MLRQSEGKAREHSKCLLPLLTTYTIVEPVTACSCACLPPEPREEVSVFGRLEDQMLVCALAAVTASLQAPTASLISSQAFSSMVGMLSLSASLWQCPRAPPQQLPQQLSRLWRGSQWRPSLLMLSVTAPTQLLMSQASQPTSRSDPPLL